MLRILLYFTVITLMTQSTRSAVIECNWDSNMENCMISSISPVTQPNEVITINGQPSNYVNTFSTFAYFLNQVVKYIPTGIFTLFPNLQALNIEKCETVALPSDALPNCGSLTTFTIRGGTFTQIPAGVVQSCKSLNFLGIGENNVTTVDVDALRGLSNLTTLFLPYSKITCLPPGLFEYTPNLLSINLYNNMIASLDSNLFANLPLLQSVSLSQNFIPFVPLLNVAGSTSQNLNFDFNSNPIYAIAPDFCSMFDSKPADTFNVALWNITCMPINSAVNTLTSSNCQSYQSDFQNCYSNWTTSMTAPVPCAIQPPTSAPRTTVPPTIAVVTTPSPTLGSCPSDKICRYFLDQYNRYTCILDGVDSVLTSISGNHLITFADSNVRRVIFTNSFLSRIPPILFQKFTSLEYLTVSNCSMSAINTNTFTACGSLKYFDASSNFITTVDGASFKSCAALEVIDLTGNKFDMISGQLFVNNPTLKAVYINRPPAMVLV